MSAYVIFIRDETVDQDEMQIYGEKASAARGDHPLNPLAFYGPRQKPLKGLPPKALCYWNSRTGKRPKPGISVLPIRKRNNIG